LAMDADVIFCCHGPQMRATQVTSYPLFAGSGTVHSFDVSTVFNWGPRIPGP
jgi:hypothetical protein